MDDICTACLCSGRNLNYIGETGVYDIYSQILSEIPVYDLSQICVRVCWECRAALRRFNSFKTQVKSSYSELLKYLHHGDQTPTLPTKQSHLKTQEVISICYPDIKIEKDYLDLNNDDPTFTQPLANVDQTFAQSLGNVDQTFAQSLANVDQTFAQSLGNVDQTFDQPFAQKDDNLEPKEEEHCEPDTFVDDLSDYDNQDLNDCDYKDEKVLVRKNKVQIIKQSKKKDKQKKKVKIKLKKEKKKNKLKEIKSKNNDSCSENELQYEEKGYEELNKMEEDSKCDIYQDKSENETVTEVPADIKVVKPRPIKLPKNLDNDKPACPECGKVFSSRKTLRYHLNVLHNGNNRYPCPRCGKVYQWKSNLGRHMRSHKARDTGELYCATCDKRFASVATYRQHLSGSKQHVSESEFNYSCNDCGKKFVSKTRLRDHIDWEHLQKIKFKCQLCNKPFKCHTSLYVHMKNVHREKGLKDNLCHVCGKSYQNRAKLRYHIVAMHTTETPYQCTQCNAAFGWYSSLYRHVREVHYKMKLQPNRTSKKSKKRLPDLIMHPPHLPLPFGAPPPLEPAVP